MHRRSYSDDFFYITIDRFKLNFEYAKIQIQQKQLYRTIISNSWGPRKFLWFDAQCDSFQTSNQQQLKLQFSLQSLGSNIRGRSGRTAIPWHSRLNWINVCHYWHFYPIHSWHFLYVAWSGVDFVLYANNHNSCIIFRAGESALAAHERSDRSGETIVMLVNDFPVISSNSTVLQLFHRRAKLFKFRSFCFVLFRLRGWVPFAKVADEYNQIYEVLETKRLEAEALKQLPVYRRIEPFTKRGFIVPFLLVAATFFAGHFGGQTPLQTYAVDVKGQILLSLLFFWLTEKSQFVICRFSDFPHIEVANRQILRDNFARRGRIDG